MIASLKASATNAASAAKERYNVAAKARKMVDEVCILFKIVTVWFWVSHCAKHSAPFQGTQMRLQTPPAEVAWLEPSMGRIVNSGGHPQKWRGGGEGSVRDCVDPVGWREKLDI